MLNTDGLQRAVGSRQQDSRNCRFGGVGSGDPAPEDKKSMESDAEQDAFMEAVKKLEADPDNEQLPFEHLVSDLSMWKTHQDWCRLFPSHTNSKLIPDDSTFSRLMRQQKLAICAAIGFMRYPKARQWEVAQGSEEYVKDAKDDEVPKFAHYPEAESSVRHPDFVPSSQCQVEPPGSGKTAVIIHLAALAARNCLIVTNSRDNAWQIVETINKDTNLSSSFPVKLVRSNEEEKRNSEFVMTKAPVKEDTHVLKHGGVYGICVIDVNTFHDYAGSANDRHGLRMRIFGSCWDLVVIDEADSVSAKQMRQAFSYGADGEALHPDVDRVRHLRGGGSSHRLRYKLKYNKLVAMSGTWHRGDPAGYKFLRSLGPITFSITSRELEDMGHLAKMEVVLVRCIDEDWVVDFAKQHKFASLTPEKMRVCERLVRFHVSHGQKIMIFTKNHWHVRFLERMFPFALCVTGDTVASEGEKLRGLFKAEVSSDHPLVWITTTAGEVGMDVPDTCVVINLVNNGESSRVLRQRMGRASRKKFKLGWFYDLVADNETEWATRLAGEDMLTSDELCQHAQRYKLLFHDGYGDVLQRLTSHELIQRLDDHVTWMNRKDADFGNAQDTMETAASAAKELNDSLVYGGEHKGMAVVDHVASCILGSCYDNESKKCDAILFDTQTQIRQRSGKEAAEAAKNAKQAAERKRKLPFQVRAGKKKKPSGATPSPASKSSDGNVPETKLLSVDDYFKFPVAVHAMKSLECREALTKAFDHSGLRLDPSHPDGLWKALMTLRHEVNETQFANDKMRIDSVSCIEVRQMVMDNGEGTQENCAFLHRH